MAEGRRSFEKRLRGTPTGSTPHQPHKRVERTLNPSAVSRRKLTYSGEAASASHKVAASDGWSHEEEKVLVEYIMLSSDGSRWEWSRKISFWESASRFLKQRCGAQRTSKFLVEVQCIYM